MRRIDIWDGLYVYRKLGSKKGTWQYYLYMDGEEVNRSTRTSDPDEAVEIAQEKWAEAKEQRRKRQKIKCPSFTGMAEEYVDKTLSRVRQAKKRKDHERRVREYLVPYVESRVGNKPLSALRADDFEDYAAWRQDRRDEAIRAKRQEYEHRESELREKWASSKRVRAWYASEEEYLEKNLPRTPFGLGHIGEEVSATALNTELGLLRAIFSFASKSRYVSPYDVPEIDGVAPDGNVRLGFSWEETEAIREAARRRFADACRSAGEKYAERSNLSEGSAKYAGGKVWHLDNVAWSRFRTMVAIDIIAATGVRPTTLCTMNRGHVVETPESVEPRRSARRNFDRMLGATDTKPAYALLGRTRKLGKKRRNSHGEGLKKERYIIPEHWAWPTIDRLLDHLPKKPNTPLIGITSHALCNSIKKVILAAGVDVDADGRERSAYDLRHGYITRRLLEGVPTSLVAENTLTSVQMVERYYAHIETLRKFDQLAGRT